MDISAYVDERDLDGQIREALAGFGPEDEVVIMTDMLGGSVNQKFCQYMSDRCHLICGVNLPCALSLVLQPEDVPLTREAVRSVVEEAKNHRPDRLPREGDVLRLKHQAQKMCIRDRNCRFLWKWLDSHTV